PRDSRPRPERTRSPTEEGSVSQESGHGEHPIRRGGSVGDVGSIRSPALAYLRSRPTSSKQAYEGALLCSVQHFATVGSENPLDEMEEGYRAMAGSGRELAEADMASGFEVLPNA